MDDLTRLRLELETLWVLDGAGRLLHCRTEAAEPPPLLVVAAGATGVTWALSAAVPPSVAEAIGPLLERAPSSDPMTTGWAPARAAEILRALEPITRVAAPHGGPSFVIDRALRAPTGVDLRTSIETDEGSLTGWLPDEDRPLTAPWVVAIVDGRAAAVCETARSAPASVEAGVWTYAPYRRQGLAARVTAAWSSLVEDRTAFYSTSWDNEASQGVARRLGLRPIGHWWQLSTQ